MTSCPSCGAAVPDDAARCPLCGTDLAGIAPDASDMLVSDITTEAPATVGPRACPVCGQLNPADARFCNACGSTLGAATRATRPAALPPRAAPVHLEGAEAPSGAARQALILVGVAVLAVVALFFFTARGGAPTDPTPATPSTVGAPGAGGAGGAQAAAVPDGPTPPLADSLQQAADALEAQNTAQGWFEAARFYLTAGFDTRDSAPEQSILWIRRSIADFEKSLAIEENADVRYALAEATQFDPSDAMRATLEAQKVLADDPRHPGGNYLLGVRRLLIGRIDSARVSFEKVLEYAPPGDDFRPLASERLAEISQTLGQAGAATRGVPDGAGAPPPAGTPAAPPR